METDANKRASDFSKLRNKDVYTKYQETECLSSNNLLTETLHVCCH